MANYQSTWWKYRNHQIRELIASNPEAEDTPTEEDVELFNEIDHKILHERNKYEGTGDGEPTPLTDATNNPITATEIEFVPLLPEYPRTHPNGYAYVVNLRHLSPHERKHALDLVQYTSCVEGPKSDIYCSFLQCHVTKKASTCTGVKYCTHIDDYLRNLCHTEVNEELVARDDMSFVRCSNSLMDNRADHHFTNIYAKRFNLDMGLLLSLLEKEQHEDIPEACTIIYQTRSRAPKCDISHPLGRGDIIPSFPTCTVKFRAFIPKDTVKHPYAIFYSRGTHNHPPPPPSKPPHQLIEEVLNLFARGQMSDSTVSGFLRGKGAQDLAARYGAKTLSELHQSFANRERFSVILAKRRAIDYPEGRQLDGVKYQIEHDPEVKLYIREVVDNEKGVFIFCALDEQLHIRASLESFEVDMSYKRVKGIFNEVIFATFVPEHGKIITLFRVFTNQETTKAYHFIFAMVFNLIERCIGKKVKFHYLHGSGIKSIVSDMCPKQMTVLGLGKMLQETDREVNDRDLGWRWHTMNVLIFLPASRDPDDLSHIEARSRLIGLMDCKSVPDFRKLAMLIKEHTPELEGWIRDKQIDVIAAGICKACSPMKPEFFDNARKHTNAVEQSHYKSYHMGTQDTLLSAVMKSRILDRIDMDQYHNRVTFDIKHSYHADDMESRFRASIRREEKKRRKHHAIQEDDIAPEDKELHEFSSSGHHSITRAKSKRGRGASRGASSSRGRSKSRAKTPTVSNLRHTTSVNDSQDENNESLEDQRKRLRKYREDLEQQERQLALRERANV
ncbi:unnamed protein product [Penicillium viridicatum]